MAHKPNSCTSRTTSQVRLPYRYFPLPGLPLADETVVVHRGIFRVTEIDGLVTDGKSVNLSAKKPETLGVNRIVVEIERQRCHQRWRALEPRRATSGNDRNHDCDLRSHVHEYQ
jgi:hypothetical protein